MLIDQLILFLKEASELPPLFWLSNYYSARKSFILQLEEIRSSISSKNTHAIVCLDQLLGTLKQNFSEIDLAEALSTLADVLESSGNNNKKIIVYKKLTSQFLKRAKFYKIFEDKRKTLSLEKENRENFTKKLFQEIGDDYCLEYYLAVYKKLSDIKNDDEKKQFIESADIVLDFGTLPGLRQDFIADEILEKFILLILDEEARNKLIISYYECKTTVLSGLEPKTIEKSLKKFIYYFLLIFKEQGIASLNSEFFTTYGVKPSIDHLIDIFQDYEQS